MNLILDTNAYIFLYKAYNEIPTPEKWGNKNFDKDKYINFCLNSSKIIVTAETVYELFLQSLRLDNTINQFLHQYNFMSKINKRYPGKIIILNGITGMTFDAKQFKQSLINSGPFDVTPWINIKIDEEMRVARRFIDILVTTTCNVLHSINGDKVLEENYKNAIKEVEKMFDELLPKLYSLCYINREIDNNGFENFLDKILKKALSYLFNKINMYAALSGEDKVFFEELESKEEKGVEYLSKVFNKISSKAKVKLKDVFKNELKDLMEILKNNSVSQKELEFIYYILEKYVMEGREIKKNDIIDSLIVTALDPRNVVKVDEDVNLRIDEIPNKDDTVLITFDKVLHKFSKSNSWLYKDNVYDNFLD